MKIGHKLVVGIPTLSTSRRSTLWIDGLTSIELPLGSSMGRIWKEDLPIADARNQICEEALEVGADYIFFLSDDVVVPPNGVMKLLSHINRPYPVDGKETVCKMVTGVYWTKGYPSDPYIWKGLLEGPFKDWKLGEFFPIDMAGCDCLLIHTDVLKAVSRPWFSTDYVWREEQQRPSTINTEDFYFYIKARREGFRLFCDTDVQCLHEDRVTGACFGLTTEHPQLGGLEVTADKDEVLVAELGAGNHAPPYGTKTKVVRFDMRQEVRPDVLCDIANLPEEYFGKFDLVSANHVLEHFRRGEVVKLIRHWAKLLKVGGTLRVAVPNIEYAMRNLVQLIDHPELRQKVPAADQNYLWSMIYGDQGESGPPWEHRAGFTPRTLENLLRSHPCLADVQVISDPAEGCQHNIIGTAKLVREDKPESLVTWWNEIKQRETNGNVVARNDENSSA